MKKIFLYTISFVTCFYFLSAGNAMLFSKMGKKANTEIFDMDEDDGDNESKDSKEDGCDEENFYGLCASFQGFRDLAAADLTFIEKNIFFPQHNTEIISPPPKA